MESERTDCTKPECGCGGSRIRFNLHNPADVLEAIRIISKSKRDDSFKVAEIRKLAGRAVEAWSRRGYLPSVVPVGGDPAA